MHDERSLLPTNQPKPIPLLETSRTQCLRKFPAREINIFFIASSFYINGSCPQSILRKGKSVIALSQQGASLHLDLVIRTVKTEPTSKRCLSGSYPRVAGRHFERHPEPP